MVRAHYWLHSKYYDLVLLVAPSLLLLPFAMPFILKFEVFPLFWVYLFQTIFWGGPHFYLTAIYIFLPQNKSFIKFKSIYLIIFFCFIASLILITIKNKIVTDYLISFMFYISVWHNCRQHYGISKIYDYIHTCRTQDKALARDQSWLYLYYAFSILLVFMSNFKKEAIKIEFVFLKDFNLVYPKVSENFYYFFAILTLLLFIYSFKRTVYDRFLNKLFIPLPQVLTIYSSSFFIVGLHYFMPGNGVLLNWVLPTLAHNIQYFGFVWLLNKKTSSLNETNSFFIKLNNNSLALYIFCLFLALITYSSFYFLPSVVFLFYIYFFSIFHYIADGFIWKKNYNSQMPSIINSLR